MIQALSTDLSIEDCHDLLEVAAVNAHNRKILYPPKKAS